MRNEIMVFHGFSKPTCNNPTPYSMNEWQEKKTLHKYDDMISFLDSEFIKEFYKSKIRLNLSPNPPPQSTAYVL